MRHNFKFLLLLPLVIPTTSAYAEVTKKAAWSRTSVAHFSKNLTDGTCTTKQKAGLQALICKDYPETMKVDRAWTVSQPKVNILEATLNTKKLVIEKLPMDANFKLNGQYINVTSYKDREALRTVINASVNQAVARNPLHKLLLPVAFAEEASNVTAAIESLIAESMSAGTCDRLMKFAGTCAAKMESILLGVEAAVADTNNVSTKLSSLTADMTRLQRTMEKGFYKDIWAYDSVRVCVAMTTQHIEAINEETEEAEGRLSKCKKIVAKTREAVAAKGGPNQEQLAALENDIRDLSGMAMAANPGPSVELKTETGRD